MRSNHSTISIKKSFFSGSGCRNGSRKWTSGEWNGVCWYYIMVSKIQWKPCCLATCSQFYPQNDWAGWQFPWELWCMRTVVIGMSKKKSQQSLVSFLLLSSFHSLLCVLHLGAYLAALPTNPPWRSRTVWSRNSREGCADMLRDVITQIFYSYWCMSLVLLLICQDARSLAFRHVLCPHHFLIVYSSKHDSIIGVYSSNQRLHGK